MPVRYALVDHIATITLDRPEKLNAIEPEMLQAFSRAGQRFIEDADAWVGIITGAGERAFCAGADVSTTIRRLMTGGGRDAEVEPPTIMRGQDLAKPLIAAINGLAFGGGLEIALACDLRIAVRGARLGFPEVGLGLIPGWGGTQRLTREAPWAVASRMILGGEPITADEALSIGLLNAVVDAAGLTDEAMRLAALLCSRGPLALQAAKRAMAEGSRRSLEAGLAFERELFLGLGATADTMEGILAFEERRPPNFTGQ